LGCFLGLFVAFNTLKMQQESPSFLAFSDFGDLLSFFGEFVSMSGLALDFGPRTAEPQTA